MHYVRNRPLGDFNFSTVNYMSSLAAIQNENQSQKEMRLQCESRLSTYMHSVRNRPLDNNLSYWEDFVFTFYDSSVDVSELWCFSSCKSLAGINAQHTNDNMLGKSCNFCGLRTQKQIVGNTRTLSKIFKAKFDNGVVDEILHVNKSNILEDLPSGGGVFMEFDKVVRVLFYEKYLVLHRGKLQVKFTDSWKIHSLKFCGQSSECFHSMCWPMISMLNVNRDLGSSSNSRDNVGDENSQTRLQDNVHQDREFFENVDEFGLPRRYWTWCDMLGSCQMWFDAMRLSIVRKDAPEEFLQEFAMQFAELKRRRLE